MTTFKNIAISMFLMIGIVFSNSLELTNLDTTAGTVDVHMENTDAVGGFQFGLSGVDITGASGGSAQVAGFTVSSSPTTVLGFSFTGATIAAGEGVMVTVTFDNANGVAETCISNAVIRSRAGLNDPSKPIGSFIFVGPTGVGKTELTKALAEFLFDDEKALVRVDMGEYMEKHSVARLIGSPPGYVGYEEGGALTESIRRRPYQVVLFDEIEKAHKDVFNLFLQILDDGRLTDGQGRTVNFSNTIIIMTSNLGAENYTKNDCMSSGELKKIISEEVKNNFKPEFINRLDDIIVFNKLKIENINEIVFIELNKFKTVLESKEIKLEFDQKVIQHISQKGYDEVFGARPIKRLIQTMVKDKIAMQILEGKHSSGGSISLSLSNNSLEID